MSQATAAAIFDRHHVAVFRYFRRMTGRHELAQDLSQEVFVRVVRGLEAYRDLGLEKAWVFRIARNVLTDHNRQATATPRFFAQVDEVSVDCRNLVALGFQEALGLLAGPDREVFVLREIDGLTYAEIAAACEMEEETVRWRLRRARLQLRTLLSRRLSQAPDLPMRANQP